MMNDLLQNVQLTTLAGILILLSLNGIISIFSKKKSAYVSYLNYIWIFFLILMSAETISFYISCWGWGILSFFTLREYFSLVDLRLQDRVGVLAAYLSIPFMMHFVHTDWYNMFIITIPVYSFLVIPFLISLASKDSEGAINSIGTIDFGLFLFVYCIGHLAYLSFHSTWMTGMLVLMIAVCDITALAIEDRVSRIWQKITVKYLIPVPLTVVIGLSLSEWTGIPAIHSVTLGLMIPALVIIGNHTISYFEADLGIVKTNLQPGRGLIIDNIKSIVFTAPIVLHYIRYFIF